MMMVLGGALAGDGAADRPPPLGEVAHERPPGGDHLDLVSPTAGHGELNGDHPERGDAEQATRGVHDRAATPAGIHQRHTPRAGEHREHHHHLRPLAPGRHRDLRRRLQHHLAGGVFRCGQPRRPAVDRDGHGPPAHSFAARRILADRPVVGRLAGTARATATPDEVTMPQWQHGCRSPNTICRNGYLPWWPPRAARYSDGSLGRMTEEDGCSGRR
jgi:hypothetical protein